MKTYQCSVCGGTFEATVSDEEADAECKKEFGVSISQMPCVIVCDDCYKEFQDWNYKAQRRN